MKILVKILIVLVVLVAIAAIVGMFFDSKIHVERAANMQSPPEAVFTQINDLKNWNGWIPWNKIDSAMKITYGEKTAGEGATYSWESDHKDVGNGTVTINKSTPNEYIETVLDFGEMGAASCTYKIEPADGGSKVTWGMDADMGSNPFKKLMGAFMDKMMEPTFEQGLKSLDSCAAAMPPPVAIMPVDTSQAMPEDTTIAR